jgi:hypothetical protein
MKKQKVKFIITQLLFILIINYLILIDSGFIFKTHWRPTFIFALTYYHVGTFITLNIAEPYLTNTAVSGAVTSALFLNVNTAVAATCDISVFGNVVSF